MALLIARVRLVSRSALQSREGQQIGMS